MDSSYFNKGDILQPNRYVKVEVQSEPRWVHAKWYHRFINWITFGKYFPMYVTYEVKVI